MNSYASLLGVRGWEHVEWIGRILLGWLFDLGYHISLYSVMNQFTHIVPLCKLDVAI
jgi:hypothetical protein